jgi:hypothetical protein
VTSGLDRTGGQRGAIVGSVRDYIRASAFRAGLQEMTSEACYEPHTHTL